MLSWRGLACTAVSLTALLVVPLAAPVAGAAPAAPSVAAGSFVVDGEVAAPLTLTVQDLRQDFTGRRVLVSFVSGEDRERHLYRGVLLIDVLNAAQPTFDPARKNDALRHSVLLTATDDYQAVVAWGEIDPSFEGKNVLLAYQEDGRALALPRLVVPGDERGGRYVTDVIEVTLISPDS